MSIHHYGIDNDSGLEDVDIFYTQTLYYHQIWIETNTPLDWFLEFDRYETLWICEGSPLATRQYLVNIECDSFFIWSIFALMYHFICTKEGQSQWSMSRQDLSRCTISRFELVSFSIWVRPTAYRLSSHRQRGNSSGIVLPPERYRVVFF
jgi:hypothetical protein